MTERHDIEDRCKAAITEKFARVRREDATVADIFAEDATILLPGGAVVEGREPIRAHYERVFDSLHPQPQITRIFAQHPHYIADLQVSTNNGEPRRTLDHFEFDDDARAKLLQIFTIR